MEVARLTEARRKPHGKHIQPKVGLSPLYGGASLRSTRSSSLRRQHAEKQTQLNAMKVMEYSHSKSQTLLLIIIYVKTAFAAASGIPPVQATEASDGLFERPTTLTGKQGWFYDYTFILIRR